MLNMWERISQCTYLKLCSLHLEEFSGDVSVAICIFPRSSAKNTEQNVRQSIISADKHDLLTAKSDTPLDDNVQIRIGHFTTLCPGLIEGTGAKYARHASLHPIVLDG